MSTLFIGKNDLETYCQNNNKKYLLDEWDYEKNYPLTPKDFSFGSIKKVWWKCDKGHSYESVINNKARKGYGCPYCNNRRVLFGFNDLETHSKANNKEYLLFEWDYEKNYPLTPKDVLPHSNKKAWWICPKGHSYDSAIQNRVVKGFQCPICSSQRLLSGYNDLQMRRPEIAALWDYEKNEDLLPTQVMAYSNRRVFWKCPDCGNEWSALICSTKGCPKCTDNYKVSESENIIYYYVSQFFPDAKLTYHASWLGRREIDIYIPSIRVAIEYDGEFWHKKTTKRDLEKSTIIINQGVLLIRLREAKLSSINDGSYQIPVPTEKYSCERLNEPLRQLFNAINESRNLTLCPDIDVDRDWKVILSASAANKRERSLLSVYPEIAATWNYEKNEGLKPENFLPHSNKKVWWKCPNCGYEWEEIISNRTKRNLPCAKCGSGYARRLIPGMNDLPSKHPEIAAEWDYEKNGDLKPEAFTYGASAKVWWRCSKCGHEWASTIANRSTGFGCPKCGKKKAAKSFCETMLHKGENDLLTVNPYVALQWDYEKNKELSPDNITAFSNKSVWWKCQVCGNSWKATVNSRAKHKNCPFCTNRRFKPGFNDIFTMAPGLKDEWDYDKNKETAPAQMICSSKKKVGWICSKCGHKWDASISRRWKGHGCPKCAVKEGSANRTSNMHKSGNTLAKMRPDIAKEWHPTKNGDLTPNMVTVKNGKKVWWLCSKCGHEWEATVHHRSNGTNCPKCAVKEIGKANKKRIINLDTMEVFESMGDAASKYGVTISAINTCISGKTRTSGNPKCRWAYYDKQEPETNRDNSH